MPRGNGLDAFREVWLVSFELLAPLGERPDPVSLMAQEFRSGRTLRLRQEDLRGHREPPYPVGPKSLFVAFEASTELGCHLALGWTLPARALDLHAEFCCRTAGLSTLHGDGLVGAMLWHGLDALDAVGKEPVRALSRLFPAMLPEIDLPRALLRGRYMGAVARMEWAGVPIDVPTLSRIRRGWRIIQNRLVHDIDQRFGVFDGRQFRADRWADWLARSGIPWPRSESGELALDDETFREMSRTHPDVALMRELRVCLSQLRPSDLTVGADGRNRVPLCPFRSKTGRNQPSTSRFIFGPATWLRGLIRPEPGRAVAYADWAQQEFGIAAALSRDPAMKDAYQSGDPYLAFGRQAGQIPPDGTRRTHGPARELFKLCALGVQFGMGEITLAQRIGRPVAMARTLLRLHRETYPRFWAWSDGAGCYALLMGQLHTVFGWTLHVGPDANPRSLRNFPCQANGAEMLRLACCLATEQGVTVCALVHDALLVEGPADAIDEVVARTRQAMAEASELVLSGFRLRTEAKVVRWPDRYMDDRGREFWGRVMALLPDGSEAGVVGPDAIPGSRTPVAAGGRCRPLWVAQ